MLDHVTSQSDETTRGPSLRRIEITRNSPDKREKLKLATAQRQLGRVTP